MSGVSTGENSLPSGPSHTSLKVWPALYNPSLVDSFNIRHLYFVDFAGYGCPVININQVLSIFLHHFSISKGEGTRGKICISISLPPTKAGGKEARRGDLD